MQCCALLPLFLSLCLIAGGVIWEEHAHGKATSRRGSAAEAEAVRAGKRGGAKAFAAALRRARASGNTALEAAIAEAKQCFKGRQEAALQQLHSALPGAQRSRGPLYSAHFITDTGDGIQLLLSPRLASRHQPQWCTSAWRFICRCASTGRQRHAGRGALPGRARGAAGGCR